MLRGKISEENVGYRPKLSLPRTWTGKPEKNPQTPPLYLLAQSVIYVVVPPNGETEGCRVRSWTLAHYAAAAAMGLGAFLPAVFLCFSAFHPPPIGISLSFATRSLARSMNCAVYSVLLFCFGRGVALIIAVAVYWVVRGMVRRPLQQLWFRYLAHSVLEPTSG